MKNTLLSLLNTPGISGYETVGGISQVIAEIASDIPGAQVTTDTLGNVWLKLGQDNRVSCAVLLELAKTFQLENIELNILWATQHEQGSSISILNWINQIQPELVVICDSAYARPNGEETWNIPELGKGTAIQLIGMDFIVNGNLANQLVDLAQRNIIPYQFEIPANDAGGTDASKIPNSIPFAIINTPVRNQHTGLGQANLKDLEASVSLLQEFLRSLG